MKKYLLLFVFAFSFLSSCTPKKTTTKYYLIRHAEKDRTDEKDRNPNLNEKGQERAKKWATYFKNIDLDAVYSTNYNRTQQTATPTAKSKNLEIKSYNPRKLYDSIFQIETKGKTILVVGHSNTTPAFTSRILEENSNGAKFSLHQNMDDHDNSSLYIVTLKGNKTTINVKKIK